MITLILIYLLLVSSSAALAYLMKYKFEQTISVVCLSMIAIMYICGLSNILAIGIYIFVALCIASGVFLVVSNYKNLIIRRFMFNNVFTPGFVVFSLFYFLICWMHRGRLLNEWMEFSHWGLVVKNMYIFNGFGNIPEATTLYRGYPPAVSLFQYLWAKVYGVFQEPNLYRSLNVLIISLLMPVFKNITWKQKHLIPFVVIIVFILPITFFSTIYINICVDAVLGVLFAYILYHYFMTDCWSMPAIINLILALFILPLVKESGFGMAIIAAFVIMLDITTRKGAQKSIATSLTPNRRNNYFILLASIVTPFIAHYSWEIYLAITNTTETWDKITRLSLSSMLAFLNHMGEDYQYQTLNSFIEALFKTPLTSASYNLSFVWWMLIFIVFAVLITRLYNKVYPKKRMIIFLAGLFLGGVVYMLSVAILYIFIFTEREALLLASYVRYMNPYPLACLLFLTYIFIDGLILIPTSRFINNKWRQSTCLLTVVVVLCSLVTYSSIYTTFSRIEINRTQRAREYRSQIERIAPMLDVKADTLYYINQNTTKYEWLVAHYIMAPLKFYGGGSDVLAYGGSIGTPYTEDDIWTENITCAEWVKRLKENCTYAYLANVDDKFIAEFNLAFENTSDISNDSLFRVDENTDDAILKYVGIATSS